MKSKKRVLIIPLIIILAVVIYLLFIRDTSGRTESYVFAEVQRGNLEIITSSTGTLEPVSLVDVGTQVSGRVDRVNVDYNAIVKEGEVLAVLDTLQLAINYRSARNDLERAQLQYDLISREYSDKQRLYERDFISELEFKKAETDMKLARLSVENAESNLDRAYLNLNDYAIIRSPINGIIIDRNVEEGQTVAASLSAPVLFTIAADLENMQIRAQVDETDIGLIKPGQSVRYTVDSYPDKSFTGVVREVRLKPEVISNVVIYTVVISTRNPEGILMPGMTATIDFIVSQKENVLLVPATALRWRPSEEEMERAMADREVEMTASGAEPVRPESSRETPRGAGVNIGILWTLDDTGRLKMNRVRVGDTDGIRTEITTLDKDLEGKQVIVNKVLATQNQANSSQPAFGGPTRMRF